MHKIRHALKNWYCVPLLIAVIVFSVFCWGSFGASITGGEETSESDTGSGPDADDSIVESVDRFVEQTDAVWKDNVFGKKALSNVDSLYSYASTGYISSTQVLLGENNWLFYKSTTDGDPIADYEGTNLYDEPDMEYITNAALNVQSELEGRGIGFSVLLAPNKENIYSELMPDTYVHAETSASDLLLEHMRAGGVHVISPKQELLDFHMDLPLYYSYDTHWNQLGAYIGAKSALAYWGYEIPSLTDRTVNSFLLEEKYPSHHVGASDDLADMAGLSFLTRKEMEYEIEGTPEMDWPLYSEEETAKAVNHYTNEQAPVKRTLLLVGDSFRTAMIPAFRESFSDVYVVHRLWYSPDLLDQINPDYVLAEYVERYSNELASLEDLIRQN